MDKGKGQPSKKEKRKREEGKQAGMLQGRKKIIFGSCL